MKKTYVGTLNSFNPATFDKINEGSHGSLRDRWGFVLREFDVCCDGGVGAEGGRGFNDEDGDGEEVVSIHEQLCDFDGGDGVTDLWYRDEDEWFRHFFFC